MHPFVEHGQQRLHGRDANSGKSLCESIGAQQHHRTHNVLGQRLAHTGTMTENQVALQLADSCRRDGDILQRTEAGGNAVHNFPVTYRALDPSARFLHPPHCRRGKHNVGAVARNSHDLFYRQRVAI